jgi:lipid-A-disaccharide synthase
MRIMISCGEASGDLYAGVLAAELRARVPDLEITGFGGERLKAAGASLAGDFAGLTVTGLTEALRVLPRSYAMYRRLVAAARARRPDVFVAIDFPDFNFRLMAALRRLGIPIVYYVSPQLWAWRTGRMQTMKRFVEKVLVIFPFEAPLYERAGVPVEFVGHPLVDLARVTQSRADLLREHGLSPDAPTVALLPGSRPNEIRRIAPVLLAALPLIRGQVPNVQFIVAAAPNLPAESFAPFREGPAKAGPHEDTERHGGQESKIESKGEDSRDVGAGSRDVGAGSRDVGAGSRDVGAGFSRLAVVHGRTDNVLAASDVVVTASGTATVQAAIHERPMVVVYRLSPLTYRLGLPFVKVDMYAMANLVAGRRVVPELIQSDFTPRRVADETVAFLTDPALHARTRDALRDVRARLGAPGATARAAEAILETVARSTRGLTSA